MIELRIEQIEDKREKGRVARRMLEALPAWFAIPQAREQYISDSENQLFLAARRGEEAAGFLCLKETGRDTAEIAVMGVAPQYRRQGIGRELVLAAQKAALQQGYSFLQVKTVQMGRYPNYDETNLFYLSLGFQEFEVFPALWDPQNPCQIYVMSLI